MFDAKNGGEIQIERTLVTPLVVHVATRSLAFVHHIHMMGAMSIVA